MNPRNFEHWFLKKDVYSLQTAGMTDVRVVSVYPFEGRDLEKNGID